MSTFRYQVVVGGRGDMLVTVEAPNELSGAVQALIGAARVATLASKQAEDDVRQCVHENKPAWEVTLEGVRLVAALVAGEDACGTANLDPRVGELIRWAQNNKDMRGPRCVIYIRQLEPVFGDAHDVHWLVEQGWLEERLRYEEETPVERRRGACGKPFYFLTEDSEDGLYCKGDRVESNQVTTRFLTTDKLDRMRTGTGWCSCVHGEDAHCPISGACLYQNPTFGPCPCSATPDSVREVLDRVHARQKETA